jgi:hypothetical protein
MQLTDWVLTEVALLLIGLTHVALGKKLVLNVWEEMNRLLDYQLSRVEKEGPKM